MNAWNTIPMPSAMASFGDDELFLLAVDRDRALVGLVRARTGSSSASTCRRRSRRRSRARCPDGRSGSTPSFATTPESLHDVGQHDGVWGVARAVFRCRVVACSVARSSVPVDWARVVEWIRTRRAVGRRPCRRDDARRAGAGRGSFEASMGCGANVMAVRLITSDHGAVGPRSRHRQSAPCTR